MSALSTKHPDLVTPVQNFLSRIVWQLTVYDESGRKLSGPESFDTYQDANDAGLFMAGAAGYGYHEVSRSEERMWIQ